MNRMMIGVIALMGAAGLAIGWTVSSGRPAPSSVTAHQALKPPVAAPASERPRHEFPLRPEDVANDRETPALAVDAQGHVVAAWAAQSGTLERTLYLARSSDGGRSFDEPTPLRKVPIYRYAARGKEKTTTFSTHVLPRLASTPTGLWLGWVEAVDGGPTVAFYVARSTDSGKTFAEPLRVHGESAKKPGFTTLTAAPDGTLLAAWLDGRNAGQQPFFTAKPVQAEHFAPERIVYDGPEQKGICPCCDIAAARLPDGSDLVAFRNNDAGRRDIWFAHASSGGPFAGAEPISSDRWTFEGCPHDGPSLAVDGETIHAAWMSAHSGKNRVYAARSPVSTIAFRGGELSRSTPGAQGHPKLVVAHPGEVYAVWDETLDPATPAAADHQRHAGHGPQLTGSGRAIMLAKATADGFGPASAVAPRDEAFQLNPAVAAAPDGALIVAWSEIDAQGKRIVIVRHEPGAEPR